VGGGILGFRESIHKLKALRNFLTHKSEENCNLTKSGFVKCEFRGGGGRGIYLKVSLIKKSC